MSAVPLPELTFEDYLKFEELSRERHEFVGGRVYVMSGGTEAHDLVVQALNARLRGPFRAKGCRTFVFNRKLKIGESVYYPDLFVTCSPSADRQFEHDAGWIVEVLSDSTEDRDRREKAAAYATLPSFQRYLLVHPVMEFVTEGVHGPEGWRWYQHGRGVLDLGGVELDLEAVFAEVREDRRST